MYIVKFVVHVSSQVSTVTSCQVRFIRLVISPKVISPKLISPKVVLYGTRVVSPVILVVSPEEKS